MIADWVAAAFQKKTADLEKASGNNHQPNEDCPSSCGFDATDLELIHFFL